MYEGFPQCVEQLKLQINKDISLPPENMGSLWAKTTLGAAREGECPPDQATWEQLRHVCLQFRDQLRSTTAKCTHVVAVRFANRELSRGTAFCIIPAGSVVCTFPADAQTVSPLMQAKTISVVGEFDSSPSTYFASLVSRGQTHAAHYEKEFEGETIVLPLHGQFLHASETRSEAGCNELNEPFLQVIRAFEEAAGRVMPSLKWMNESSLHCTVRGLR